MAHQPTSNWQPLSFLSKLAEMIDGMLESAEDVCGSLQHAQHWPHVMDVIPSAACARLDARSYRVPRSSPCCVLRSIYIMTSSIEMACFCS